MEPTYPFEMIYVKLVLEFKNRLQLLDLAS